jgi:hypothetical protein
MKKVTLPTWAAAQWDPAPSVDRLRRWARNGNISPPPQKVGREYYVLPTARYVDRNGRST